MPQNREKGSSVSGMAPRLRYDSSEDDDELSGEIANCSVGRVGEVEGEVNVACEGSRVRPAGRKANGGTPRRVAEINILQPLTRWETRRTNARRPEIRRTGESYRFPPRRHCRAVCRRSASTWADTRSRVIWRMIRRVHSDRHTGLVKSLLASRLGGILSCGPLRSRQAPLDVSRELPMLIHQQPQGAPIFVASLSGQGSSK